MTQASKKLPAQITKRGTRASWGAGARRASLALALAAAQIAALAADPAPEINPPIGPYVHLSEEHFARSTSYSSTNRLVLTPYFYWYDSYTGAHLVNSDGSDALTDHPPTLEDFSFRSQAWHEKQLRDMMNAGIDVLLPVYWGEPSQRIPNRPVSAQPWSYAGLPPLVAARKTLVEKGLKPPRIGMFYDTSTLQHNKAGARIDLTTPYGRRWFYESVRDFFSLIPPEHWAMIDGKPILFLYSASFAAAHDQSCIDYLRQTFAADFGGREPYIVREISWNATTENVYAWGGALGLKNPGVASLGPGYDHSAVPGRQPLVVDRENGAFFERNWIRFLRRPSNLVFIETWNEFHEGTDIAESREYGRQYIELNRQFADMFRKGVVPPRPRGPYSDFKKVSVTLGETNRAEGLYQIEAADGATEPAEIGGSPCRAVKPTVYAGRYIYFRIDDSFKWADLMQVEVRVEYFDHPAGRFSLEFDGSDTNAPFQGAYSPARLWVTMRGTGTWKTTAFRLNRARFENSQNSGADFRLVVQADAFHVRRVEVIRPGLPEEAGALLPGSLPDLSSPWQEQWLFTGDPATIRQSAGGLLTLAGSDGAPGRLLLRESAAVGDAEEALARVRLRRPPASAASLGGLIVAPANGAEPAARLEFLRGQTPGLRLSVDGGPETQIAYNWRPNLWYWVRLRQAAADPPGHSDLWARVWPADGESPEPRNWTLSLNLAPVPPSPDSRFGLEGPSAPGALLEADWFLLKSENAEPVLARLPALRPPWLGFREPAFDSAGGFRLALEGAPERFYALERSENLIAWETVSIVRTDDLGEAAWSGPASAPRSFYRLREKK
ncbi:MAG: DUF5010 domain-containing protein [Verrucomicrobia bacterium]|nr:DUF5010 domain-containing protein [Verrucomicrobiota bacterium]